MTSSWKWSKAKPLEDLVGARTPPTSFAVSRHDCHQHRLDRMIADRRRIAVGTVLLGGYWVVVSVVPISFRFAVLLAIPYCLIVHFLVARRWPLDLD